MSDEFWDRELTMEEFKKLEPAMQRKRIDTSLARKVAELQRWSVRGVPSGVAWRERGGSRAKLREWHDPRKKLWRWSDDSPDHPKGRNRGLMARWKTTRDLLSKGTSMKPRSEVDLLKERLQALEFQNTSLIADKAYLEDRLRRCEDGAKIV